jgi:hypothetical protein
MSKERSRKVSCIWIQVTQQPQDPIARIEFPIGTRIICNKKKFPYLYKYGFLRFKKPAGECKLYFEEFEVIVEKKYEKDFQRDI